MSFDSSLGQQLCRHTRRDGKLALQQPQRQPPPVQGKLGDGRELQKLRPVQVYQRADRLTWTGERRGTQML